MDFNIVRKQIGTVYQAGGYWSWSCQDFIRVFERFYGLYYTRRGVGHPVLRTETIARVMRLLIEDADGTLYAPEDYLESDLFECYFDTRYKAGCDYSIVHFTSGDVRHYKTFEAVI